jgi:hypothetical protein
MKIQRVDPIRNKPNIMNKLQRHAKTEDLSIDIFSESLTDYLQKLNAASKGRYELDDYDMHVISIAMDQYIELIL